MTDCINCIHKGAITLGKLHCHKYHEEVEPYQGKYPADSCSCYMDNEGNTNPDATECPKCQNKGILQETGSGYHTIRCCNCGLTVTKNNRMDAIDLWNREVLQ